ncbi:MAG: M14 family zinc carboxypeptidase, partial [Planctomycetota bacterium]
MPRSSPAYDPSEPAGLVKSGSRRQRGSTSAAAATNAAPAPSAGPSGSTNGPDEMEWKTISRSGANDSRCAWTAAVSGSLRGRSPRRRLGLKFETARRATLHAIPSMNPDGHGRGSRYNVNGIDLNRNWPAS